MSSRILACVGLCAALSAPVFGGCKPKLSTEVVASPEAKKASRSYAVMPFDDRNKGLGGTFFPEAPEVIREALETALLENGQRTVERGQLQQVLAEVAFSNSGFAEADRIKVGQLANAEILVFGAVNRYLGGRGRAIEIEFEARAVDVQTGSIVWKGSAKLLPRPTFEGDKRKIARALASELVQKVTR